MVRITLPTILEIIILQLKHSSYNGKLTKNAKLNRQSRNLANLVQQSMSLLFAQSIQETGVVLVTLVWSGLVL